MIAHGNTSTMLELHVNHEILHVDDNIVISCISYFSESGDTPGDSSTMMMELDQEMLDALPRSQRLKFAKKARQQQLKEYYKREEEEDEVSDVPSTPNKKGQHVNFVVANQLRDAVTRFDDKEGNILHEAQSALKYCKTLKVCDLQKTDIFCENYILQFKSIIMHERFNFG